MTNQTSLSLINLNQFANLDLHELEATIADLEKSPLAEESRPKLQAARQALRHRQRTIKSDVMEFEATNDHHLLFFDSTANFSKLAGHSVLFFSMNIAARINWRHSVKIDSDHYYISEDGIISFRSLSSLSKSLAKIDIYPDDRRSTSELHYFLIPKAYTEEEIAKLRDRTERDLERIAAFVLPSSSIPALYDAIKRACYLIYYEFQHASDRLARETIGHRMIEESYDLMSAYVNFSRISTHNDPSVHLARMLDLNRSLRNGMLYLGELHLIRHRNLCHILEQLTIIDRLATRAYQKSLTKASSRYAK